MQRSLIFGASMFFVVLSGCVTSGTYRQKNLQAEGLEASLREQRVSYGKLVTENATLKGELERLTGELAALVLKRDALAASRKGLEDSLKSSSEARNQKIGELSRRLSELEAENSRLKDDLVQLQKLKDTEVEKTSRTYEDLLESLKNEISRAEVTISELKGKLTVSLVEPVLFDSGKAQVRPDGLLVLQKVADILKNARDKAIRIEGHTDIEQTAGRPADGDPANWELSAARAVNVAKYLQQLGIDPALLAVEAFGEYKPLAPSGTKEGRTRNRRIEIVLIPKE